MLFLFVELYVEEVILKFILLLLYIFILFVLFLVKICINWLVKFVILKIIFLFFFEMCKFDYFNMLIIW